jgi:hypothetical protein
MYNAVTQSKANFTAIQQMLIAFSQSKSASGCRILLAKFPTFSRDYTLQPPWQEWRPLSEFTPGTAEGLVQVRQCHRLPDTHISHPTLPRLHIHNFKITDKKPDSNIK